MRPLSLVFFISSVTLGAAGCGDDSLPPILSDSSVGDGAMDASGDGGTETDSGVADTSPEADGGGDAATDTGPVSMPCTAIGPCDPFDPGSCPAGETCHPGIGMTECVAQGASPTGPGETCALSDECAPGLLCLDFGDGSICERMCPRGSVGFCGEGQACTGAIGGDMCIRICRPIAEPCDIYTQDCVDPDDACTLARHPETEMPYTGCRPAGSQGKGMPCGGADGQCQPGLVCLSEAGIAACRQVCGPDGGAPMCSGTGESCDGISSTWMVPYCR